MVSNDSVPTGTVRVVLANDYTGPGSGLGSGGGYAQMAGNAGYGEDEEPQIPVASPILTAGSDDPQCVN
nr:cell envelope-related transcriptional attenuator [Mycolicibacter nonchromogenicus]